MTSSLNARLRLSALAFISILALTACGGGGGSSSGGGTSPPTTTTVVETCDGGNSSGANAVAPCVTITGLAAGQSVKVSDGISSMTETGNGTFTFPSTAFVSNGNGGMIQPALTFSMSSVGGAQCTVDGGLLSGNTGSFGSNLAQGGSIGAHMTLLCGTYPAVTPSIPTVTTMPGVSNATVIAAPDIIPVVLQGTVNQASDLSFVQQLTASKVWKLLSQYGVGGATVGAVKTATNPGFSLSAGSVITAQQMAAYLQSQASTLDPGFTNNTVFVFFLPPGVQATYLDNSLTQSGQPNAAGITGQVTVNGASVTYALVQDTSQNFYQTNSVIYEMIEIALVQAVTNPSGTNGYAWMSANPDVWLGASAPKLTDLVTSSPTAGANTVSIATLCASLGQTAYTDITAGDILPIWSQADASAGRSPCQPMPIASQTGVLSSTLSDDATTPFYGVVPGSLSAVSMTLGGIARSDEAVEVAPGQSVTLSLTFFSTQPMQSDVDVTPSVVSYISATTEAGTCTAGGTGVQPVMSAGCTPLISVSQVTNQTRPSAGQKATNGDTLQVTITAASTHFSGMYVIQFGNGQLLLPLAVKEP